MIKEIKSRQNELIKEVTKLNSSSYRKKAGIFKVEGFHMLEMAFKAKVVTKVFSLEKLEEIDEKIPQYIVSKEVMEKITETKSPQGVVAVCNLLPNKTPMNNKVLYLDGVSDPGNLGTILRTALAFGFKDVVLSKECCSIYNDKVLQASQGSIFSLNISNEFDLVELKKKGYKILATEIKGSIDLESVKKPEKFVLVLGNEAHGVSEDVLKIADQRIRIDISDIESLNVAIAGAISMYHLK